MAFTLGDAIVRVLGEDSQLGKTLKNSEGAVTGFTQRAGNAIRGAFGTAMKVGLAAVVTGVVALGTMAINTETQFRDSQKKIRSALGLTEEQAVGVGESMRDVWANNFGDSVADVEQGIISISEAFERLGGVSNEQLTASTEDAFRLRDAYKVEVSEGVGAAATLMDEFGLTADEAFDFITKGMQDGLNSSDDFLDSIGEYSNQFKGLGLDAHEMYSILQTGSKGGVLGTDKVADAFKEMGIILNEGGSEVSDTFDDMGMNFEGMQASVKDGSATWGDYIPAILEGLQAIEDPLARSAAETALFGTAAEDLGVGFTDAISTVQTGMEDMAGATDTLNEQYETWPAMFEGMRRSGIDALEPLTSHLLDMANDAMPQIKEQFALFVEQLIVALPDIIAFVDKFIEFAVDWGPTILTVLAGAVTAFTALGIIATVAGWISSLVAAWGAVSAAIAFVWPFIVGIGALLSGPVLLAIAAVVAVVALLAAAWNNNWFGIQEKTATAVEFIKTTISTFLENIQTWWAENKETIIATVSEMWETVKTKFTDFVDTIKNLITAFKEGMNGDWTAMKEELTTIVVNLIATIVTKIGGLWAKIKPKITEAITGMKNTFNDVDWAGIGKSIIDGVKNGIEAAKDALFSTMKGIADGALQSAKDALFSNSPAKKAYPIGESIPDGMVVGIKNRSSQVKQAMQDLVAIPDGLVNQAGGLLAGGGVTNSNNRSTTIGGDRVTVHANGNAADVAAAIERRKRAKRERRLGY